MNTPTRSSTSSTLSRALPSRRSLRAASRGGKFFALTLIACSIVTQTAAADSTDGVVAVPGGISVDGPGGNPVGEAAAAPAPVPIAQAPVAPNTHGKPVKLGAGAWTYFIDPRAVSNATTTFTGWITSGGYVNIASYSWVNGAVNVKRMHPHTGADDHNNPAIVIRRDGRLVVFFSPHSGLHLPKRGKSRMYYAISRLPGKIGSWGRVKSVSVNVRGKLGYTYPNPIVLGHDNIWLAWRGGNWDPTRSLLTGNGWKQAKNILRDPGRNIGQKHGDTDKSKRPDRPYTKYAVAKNGRIHMAYTQAHPYDTKTNLYYVSINPRTDRLYRANGRRIGSEPIRAKSGELVAKWSSHGRVWVMDVSDDGSGRPVIVYSTGWSSSRKIRFRMTRWTGSHWEDHLVTYASDHPRRERRGYGHTFFSGGLAIDHNDPHRLFVSRGVGSNYQVEVWTADANYQSWTHEVVSPKGQSCFRPAGTTGAGPTMVVFLCGWHRTWTRYATRVYGVTLAPTSP